ncbi:MAG: DoxX family protein [Bdellovibrio sp.]|nr:DoxX family protein [Bdellovibrio sp.]
MNLHAVFFETTPELFNIATLVVRIFIGVCFVIHGLGKLGIVGQGSMAGFEGWLKSLGLPFAAAQARMAMLCEVVGGILIILGLLTRVGATLCLVTMIVAGLIGHKGGGYLITNTPP